MDQSASRRKSAGVNLLDRTVLPSTVIFCFISTAILFTYGIIFREKLSIIGGLTACSIGLIVLWLIISRLAGSARSKRIFLLRTILTALFLGGISSSIIMVSVPHGNFTTIKGPFTGTVLSAVPGRHSNRITAEFVPVCGGSSTKAIGYVDKSIIPGVGSTLVYDDDLVPINDDPFASRYRYGGITHKAQLYEGKYVFTSLSPETFRNKIRNRIISLNEKLYGTRISGVVNALQLGDGYFVDRKTTYDFTRAGLLHILAASGTHIALVSFIPLWIFARLSVSRRTALVFTCIIIALYFEITCQPVSLLRACIMFFVGAFVFFTGRGSGAWNTLCIAGSILLLLYPEEIYSLGFQLSFAATGGLILFYTSYTKSVPKLPLKIHNSLALTLSAQLPVFPIIACTLSQFNVTSIIANIAVVPVMGAAFTLSVPISICGIVSPQTGIYSAKIVKFLLELSLSITEFFARLPGHYVIDGKIIFTFIPLTLCVLPLLIPRIKKGYLSLFIIFLVPITSYLIFHFPSATKQTDSQNKNGSIVFAKNKAIIHDLTFENNSIEDIKKMINNSDYRLIEIEIQNADWKTISNCEQIVKQLPVTRITLPATVDLNKGFERLLKTAEREGVQIYFKETLSKL